MMGKRRLTASFLILFTLLLMLSGCGGENISGTTGTIKFYYEPTEEFTAPAGMGTVNLSSGNIKEIQKIIDNIDEWDDDYLVNRLPYYFNGEIELSDTNNVYYFMYEHNVIYYDHYIGQITDEEMEYIKHIV